MSLLQYTNYYPRPNFTLYKSDVSYPPKPSYSISNVEGVVNRFTHYVFDTLAPDFQALPIGYLVAKNNKTLNLGPMVETNEWDDLLIHYWLLLLIMLFLLALLIIIPFVAVCYCCFCCCRCNKDGCPPCDAENNARKGCCLGYILVLLIVAIIFGIIISLESNNSLNQSIELTFTEIKMASDDTCKYLKDVSDHIHHLLVNNYEELCVQIISVLKTAHDASYTTFLKDVKIEFLRQLISRFDNMPKAMALMKEVSSALDDLRFWGAQYRDGLRAIRRDITYTMTVLCGNSECLRYLKTSQIETLESSKCLHFDELPNPNNFTVAMQHIIENEADLYFKGILSGTDYWFNKRGVEPYYKPMVDLIIQDLNHGKELFRLHAEKTRSIIESVIGDIHMSTHSSTNSFDDVVTKFGNSRSSISILVCVFLTIIVLFLIIGIICGCCGRHLRPNRRGCCNKRTGSVFLLIAIMIIFCVFSFILLVGIFYLVIGLLTYQGACAPRRDQQENSFFRILDPPIDINKYLPRNSLEPPLPPLRMSNVLKAYHANQSMCDLLKTSGLYDIEELDKVNVIKDHKDDMSKDPKELTFTTGNVSNQNLYFINSHIAKYAFLIDNDMMNYNSTEFTMRLCKKLTPLDLSVLAVQLMKVRSSLWTQWGIYDWARISLVDEAELLMKLHNEVAIKVESNIELIRNKLAQIDGLILLNSSFTYKQAVQDIPAILSKGERVMWDHCDDYYLEQRLRLTTYMGDFVELYKKYAKKEFCSNVGTRAPIDSIYKRGVEIVCDRLINPLNRIWVGLLFSSLLLIPIVYLAHRLMCLYKNILPDVEHPANANQCPVCTADPLAPPFDAANTFNTYTFQQDSAGCSCNI